MGLLKVGLESWDHLVNPVRGKTIQMDKSLLSQKKINNTFNTNKIDYLTLVSVIIATYHREESLERALSSLISQTYENIEIIVIDDNANLKWNKKVEDIIKTVEHRSMHGIFYIKNEVNNG